MASARSAAALTSAPSDDGGEANGEVGEFAGAGTTNAREQPSSAAAANSPWTPRKEALAS